MNRHIIPALLAAILFFVGLSFFEQAQRWWTWLTPPIEWRGVEVVTKEVSPGGILKVTYSAVINRTCPADLRGFLIGPDGEVPVRFPLVPGGYSRPSGGKPVNITVALSIPLQPDRPFANYLPGPYTYRAIATCYCPDGIHEDTEIPDADFILKTAGAP